jgi:uncharacterized protein YrrD
MQFVQNASVFAADGEQIGEIERVVMDPRSRQVTHVVVRKGFFFTEDRVVPVSLVASADDERVELREDAGDLEGLPIFEEEHFVTTGEEEYRLRQPEDTFPPLYWYPPVYGSGYGAGKMYPAPPLQPVEIERNIPEGSVALREGARVVSADGEHVGDVEQVLTEPEADRVTHFVVSKGFLLKERKLVPMGWVARLGEDQVHLAVGTQLLKSLRDYKEPS